MNEDGESGETEMVGEDLENFPTNLINLPFQDRGMDDHTVICDKRGRVVIPKKVREAYGEKFWLLEFPKKLILYPVPKDPIGDMAREGKRAGISNIPIKVLKQEGRKHALKEIEGEWKGN